MREKAIINFGQEAAIKSRELFEAFHFPNGLLPLQKVVEGGWVEETGFVWLVTEEAQKHHFVKPDRISKYDELVTCTISPRRMKDIRGVKAKDMGIWVPVNEIYIDEKKPDKIVFKSIMGLSRSFPVSDYVLDE
ncbi:hypothetical protein KP509_13G068900 [Ceratopteris richardii]|nr:hypothetical protein KP509_13G068900 [Ceratopteris richardii]